MALIKKTSNPYHISIVCEKFGKRVTQARMRKVDSKKCGCKFELIGCRAEKDPNSPNPKWMWGVVEGRHNHPSTWDMGGNAFMGRMTPDEQVLVRGWGDDMRTPKQIVAKLRSNNPENVTKRKQVANFLYKLQYEDRGELTVTQWSLKFLKDNGYTVAPIRDSSTNEVQILFFAHRDSLRLLKKFPYVVIVDATYKTNK